MMNNRSFAVRTPPSIARKNHVDQTDTNTGIPPANQAPENNLSISKLKNETRITGFAIGSPGAPRNYASDQIKASWVKAENLRNIIMIATS